jgi:hypothetical protein
MLEVVHFIAISILFAMFIPIPIPLAKDGAKHVTRRAGDVDPDSWLY